MLPQLILKRVAVIGHVLQIILKLCDLILQEVDLVHPLFKFGLETMDLVLQILDSLQVVLDLELKLLIRIFRSGQTSS